MRKQYHTKSRDHIMEYLISHREMGFRAQDVREYMESRGISMNLTTIYRNLDTLARQGVVVKYQTAGEDGCKYQYVNPSRNCAEHIHMQCRKCGRIFHLECAFMEDLSRHLLAHHDFQLECSGSLLRGVCCQCGMKNA